MTGDSAAARIRAVLDEHIADGRLSVPRFDEDDIRQLLDEHEQQLARVAELAAYADSLTGAVKAAADFTDAMQRIRQLSGATVATATANAELIAKAVQQLAAATCPCGCVAGQPCRCGLEDCECVGDCGICDRQEDGDARSDNCERCGGAACSECGECPRQGCWDCRCDQREPVDDAGHGDAITHRNEGS